MSRSRESGVGIWMGLGSRESGVSEELGVGSRELGVKSWNWEFGPGVGCRRVLGVGSNIKSPSHEDTSQLI